MTIESQVSLLGGRIRFSPRTLQVGHEEVIEVFQINDPELDSLYGRDMSSGVGIRVLPDDEIAFDRFNPHQGPLVSANPARVYSAEELRRAPVISTQMPLPFGKQLGRLLGYKKTFSVR